MWYEFLLEGLKKFAGEIIGLALIAFALWAFPGLRSLFTKVKKLKKDDAEAELERVREVQRSIEAQRQEQERIRAEIQNKEKLAQEEARKLEETLKRTEIKRRHDTQQQVKTSDKRPALSDSDFIELCKSGDTQKVEEAIIDGANVNAIDEICWTALIWAAIYGFTEILEVLLKYNADVNTKSDNGRTALLWTIGHPDTANLLRYYGAKE